MIDEAESTPGGEILIVDNTPAVLRLLSQQLTDQGHKVRAVTNCTRAAAIVAVTQVDLILMDLSMSQDNCHQECSYLKRDALTKDIPIIFISKLGEKQDSARAFAAGGVDYITKPFQSEEVLARVATHLARRDLQRRLHSLNIELDDRLAELAQANVELRTRNEELDAFAHTVAHDLKIPLSPILGYGEILLCTYADSLPEGLREPLQQIVNGSRRMNSIIDELLLFASVRTMQEIDTVHLDMARLVAEAQARLSHMVEQPTANIVLPSSWPTAVGYGPWVVEVWTNYLSNAFKYGGQPALVQLGADRLNGRNDTIRFWVKDNGKGVTLSEQANLFTPFARLSQVRAKGHGLGLSIVRRIVERLGGEVGVHSEPGRGSTFWFTLPSAPPE